MTTINLLFHRSLSVKRLLILRHHPTITAPALQATMRKDMAMTMSMMTTMTKMMILMTADRTWTIPSATTIIDNLSYIRLLPTAHFLLPPSSLMMFVVLDQTQLKFTFACILVHCCLQIIITDIAFVSIKPHDRVHVICKIDNRCIYISLVIFITFFIRTLHICLFIFNYLTCK